jgi:outer membrane receptor for ferric coprogen and ferric-rhodotorulic acid
MENIDAAFVSIPLNLFITGIDKGRQLSAKGKVIADVRISYQVTNYLKLSLIVNNVFNAELMTRPADLRPPRLTMIQFSFAF